MTSNTSDIALKNFFIYYSSGSHGVGQEDEKLLYYYPRETTADVKMKEVGLTEGIIQFTETFSEKCCENFQTKKTRKLFLHPEDKFWLIMTITLPIKYDSIEGTEEYLGNEVQVPLYQATLRQAYNTSRLFIGPYVSALTKNGMTFLKTKFDMFFTRYLLNVNLKDTDIIELFEGLRFLPLDKPTFLHTQCFINSVEASFPLIEHTMLLFNNELIWSGIGADDAQIIYRYIVYSLLPSHLQATKSISALTMSRTVDPVNRYVSGPDTLNDNVYTDKTPKVYLSTGLTPGHYHLVVYKFQQLTIALLIPSEKILKLEFYRNLDTFLSIRMEKICKEILQFQEQQQLNDISTCTSEESNDISYVYFNSLNLATMSTIGKRKYSSYTSITKELLDTLIAMHQHQKRLSDIGINFEEHIVKTMSDHWIIGRMSNSRHFYVTLDRKKTNLVEVSEEVKRICEKRLNSIFFEI